MAATAGCNGYAASQPATQPDDQPAAKPVERNAEAGPLRAIVAVDRDRLAVDETLTMTIRLESPVPLDEMPPPFTGAIGNFLIAESTEPDVDCSADVYCREWRLVLENALPGEHVLQGLNIPFMTMEPQPDGTQQPVQTALQTEPITIHVTGALADIRSEPLVVSGPFPWTLVWWALGVFGVLAAAGLAVRYWPGRTRQPAAAPQPPPVIPHEWALAEFDRLERENLIARGMVQEYYYRINALLRRYIELRFNLNAGEQTSEEFIRALQYSHELDATHKTLLNRFVEACDPVKYAAAIPTADDIQWVTTTARRFVIDTAPKDEQMVASRSPADPARQEAAR